MGVADRPATAKRERTSTRDERRERVEAALGSPAFFGHCYMRPFDPGWKRAGRLPRVTMEFLAFMSQVRFGVILTPPEFLKTTAIHTYATWVTCSHAAAGTMADCLGMFTSEEQALAERNMGVVAWHLTENPLIRQDFVDVAGRPLLTPDPEEDKWTDSEIIVRREGKQKDPTWQAKGYNAKGVQSARLRYLIGDDVVTPRTAFSPKQQAEAVRLWDTQFTRRVLADGQAILFGNFNSSRDLLAQLSKRKAYATLRRPALHVKGDRSKAPADFATEGAIEQMPEKWPLDRILANRDQMPNTARRVLLLDDKAEVGERLKWHWLAQIDPHETPRASTRWVIGIDPAPGGESDDLDYFNITVAGLHGEGMDQHLDLAVSHDFRGENQWDLLARYHDRFDRVGLGVSAIGVSKVALDRYFALALSIMRPDLRAKLVPIGVGTASKQERLQGLGPMASSGWMRLWDTVADVRTSDPDDQAQELTFGEQWRGFWNIQHDDKLDGADIAARTAIEFGSGEVAATTFKLKVASGR